MAAVLLRCVGAAHKPNISLPLRFKYWVFIQIRNNWALKNGDCVGVIFILSYNNALLRRFLKIYISSVGYRLAYLT